MLSTPCMAFFQRSFYELGMLTLSFACAGRLGPAILTWLLPQVLPSLATYVLTPFVCVLGLGGVLLMSLFLVDVVRFCYYTKRLDGFLDVCSVLVVSTGWCIVLGVLPWWIVALVCDAGPLLHGLSLIHI